MRIKKGSVKRANEGLTMLIDATSGRKNKPLRDCGKDFVDHLIKLTKNNELIWKVIILNAYETRKNEWRFVTEMIQDGRPYLKIEIPNSQGLKHIIEGNDYDIAELNHVIYKKQKEQVEKRIIKTTESENEIEKERQKLITRAVIFTTFQAALEKNSKK